MEQGDEATPGSFELDEDEGAVPRKVGFFRRIFNGIMGKIIGIGSSFKAIFGQFFDANFWQEVLKQLARDMAFAGIGAMGSRFILISREKADANLGNVQPNQSGASSAFSQGSGGLPRPASTFSNQQSAFEADWSPRRR